MPLILQVFVFAFGAVIGSFLNAVLWRLRTGESIVFGRSYCPHCQHALGIADLFPILSFAFLRGHCRYCKKGIHPSYLIVECVVGVLFLLVAHHDLGRGLVISSTDLAQLLLHWFGAAILVIIFVYDLRYMLVPRKTVLVAAALAAAANLALGHSLASIGFGVLFGGAVFHLQYVLSRGRWVGGGDADIGVFIGALLGFKIAVAAIFASYIIGAFVGIGLITASKKTLKSQVPFGTFLAASAFVMMLCGEKIIAWYMGLI